MGYISATMKRNDKGFVEGDEVYVWECIDHKHVLKKYPGVFEFFMKNEDGEHTSIFNDKLKKYEFDNLRDFRAAKKMLIEERGEKLYESDIGVDTKVLSKYYYNQPAPDLNIMLYDIEVDYKSQTFPDETVVKIRMKPK